MHARGMDWDVLRSEQSDVGKIVWANGLEGAFRNRECCFLMPFERDVETIDPAAVELVGDTSNQYRNTRLYIDALLRTTAPVGLEPTVQSEAVMDIKDFQLVPLRHVLKQERVRLLIADDVGLGKTLEAGLIAAELMARGRANRILVVTKRAVLEQFQREFWTRFSIPLTRLDSDRIKNLRQSLPASANPFDYFEKAIVSIDTVKGTGSKGASVGNELRDFISQSYWDLVIIDEAHHAALSANSTKNMRTHQAAQILADRCDSLLLLTATPHDGSHRSLGSLIKLLDSSAIASIDDYHFHEIKHLMLRRTRHSKDVRIAFNDMPLARNEVVPWTPSRAEEHAYDILSRIIKRDRSNLLGIRKGHRLISTVVEKALFSSPSACIDTVRKVIRNRSIAPEQREDYESLLTALEAIGTHDFSKFQAFVKTIRSQEWSGNDPEDRLVVFSERIETLNWLKGALCIALGLQEDAIRVLHGATGSDEEIQRTVNEFGRKSATIRILLASDMASEGLNLHHQSHRLFHFDTPWALITFHQRNGRIDRYGQPHTPLIWYFSGEIGNDIIGGDSKHIDAVRRKNQNVVEKSGVPLINNIDKQEDVLFRAMEEGMSEDLLDREIEEQSFDPFLAFMEEPVDTEPSSVPADHAPPLYSDKIALFSEALSALNEKPEYSYEFEVKHQDALDFPIPKEFGDANSTRLTGKWFPREAIPKEGRPIHFSTDITRVSQAIVDAQRLEGAWPQIQYLSGIHPAMRWLEERVKSSLFGRRRAPVVDLRGTLPADQVVYLFHGAIRNNRGTSMVDLKLALAFDATGAMRTESFDQALFRSGLKHGTAIGRGAPDLVKAKEHLAKAVECFQDLLIERRRARQVELNEYSTEVLLAAEHRATQLKAYFTRKAENSKGIDKVIASRLDDDIRTIEKDFQAKKDWVKSSQTIPQSNHPYVTVAAILIG